MATTYISRTFTSGDTDKWTFSAWLKRCPDGVAQFIFSGWADASNYTGMYFDTDESLHFYNRSGGGAAGQQVTSALFRDPGSWYHLVFVWDSGNATSGDRMRIYVNGEEVTAFAVDNAPTQDLDSSVNVSGNTCYIGQRGNGLYWNGEMSHVQFVDGAALAASDFGETDSTSGIWKIKTSVYGTPGTNGFCLKMEDRTNLDLDSSSNALTFTTTGTATATYDNPSNNFCTMNGIWYGLQSFTLENGNTRIIPSANYGFPGSMAMNKGKWYFEAIPKAASAGIGIVSGSAFSQGYLSDGTYAGGFGSFEGNKAYGYVSTATTQYLLEATTTTESWGANLNHTTDVLQIALDLDNNFLYFGINGTWQNSGVPTSGSTGTGGIALAVQGAGYPALGEEVWAPFAHSWDTTVPTEFNFGNGYFGTTAVSTSESDDAGEGSFEFDVPAGFYAICTKNIKAYGG